MNKKMSIKEKLPIMISSFSLFVSIISIGFGIYQYNKSKNYENQKGELELTIITYRYFSAFTNAFDLSNPKYATIKRDPISINQYLNECNSILTDFNSLINNPFMIGLFEKYPNIINTIVQLRRDMVEQGIKAQQNIDTFALSSDSFVNFYRLLVILKKEQKDSDIFKDPMISNLDKKIKAVIDVNPVMSVKLDENKK